MIDLNKLTPLQHKVAHRFLDALRNRQRVCFEDFPEMEPDDFEELAEAIIAFMEGRH